MFLFAQKTMQRKSRKIVPSHLPMTAIWILDTQAFEARIKVPSESKEFDGILFSD